MKDNIIGVFAVLMLTAALIVVSGILLSMFPGHASLPNYENDDTTCLTARC